MLVARSGFRSIPTPDSVRWEQKTKEFVSLCEVKEMESPVEWSQQVLCLSGLNTFTVLGLMIQPPNGLLEGS